MHRRPEFSFQGSPPRPRTTNTMEPPRSPGEEEVRWLQASRQGSPDYSAAGSGTPPSPQLWASHHRPYPASAGSSPTRAQAIAGYRREMLDLVRGLPESAYELSLRDIVDRPSPPSSPLPPPPPTPPTSSTTAAAGRDRDEHADAKRDVEVEGRKQSVGSAKKQGRRKQRTAREQRTKSFGRSVSLDTGLLIKLFLPLSMGGGGGKKKVSPKPDAGKKKKEKTKQGRNKKEGDVATQDEEWWTNSEATSSSRTNSIGSSNSAGSVRNGNGSSNPKAPVRSRSRKRTGCYAFFRANKSSNGPSQD